MSYYRLLLDGVPISSVLSLGQHESEHMAALYPNPFDSVLHLELEALKTTARLTIFDIAGRLQKQYTVEDKSVLISVQDLCHGIYIAELRYQDNDQAYRWRIFRQ